MAFKMTIDKDNQVRLIVNTYHEKGDNRPCLKGALKINGVTYDVAIWAPKEGKKSYSGKVTMQEGQTEPQTEQPQQAQSNSIDDWKSRNGFDDDFNNVSMGENGQIIEPGSESEPIKPTKPIDRKSIIR